MVIGVDNYVSVIGAGAWGTAIAQALARNGHWVCLYTHEAEVAATINQTHQNNKYLPDVTLAPTVWATTSVERTAQASIIFVAIPVPYLRQALKPFRGFITRDHVLVSLSKGVEQESGALPLEIIGESVGVCHTAVLGGPNFAADLTHGKIMGTIVASRVPQITEVIFGLLQSSTFKVTRSDDPIGVQWCGVLKNILALQNGIITGQKATDSTRAYLLTQGLADMATVVTAFGGKRSTVYGLAGVGDVVLSGWCAQGRNYRLGLLLGQGQPLVEALKQFNSPPEGLNTAQALGAIIAVRGLSVPTLSSTCEAIMSAIKNI